jgi:hypothetical protein
MSPANMRALSWLLLAFILLSFCALLMCVSPWGLDEGVITIHIDNFLKTGHLSYLFQHHNAPHTFGKDYYAAILIFQHHPLDPSLYALSRAASGICVFLSSLAVAWYLERATKSILLGAIGALALLVFCDRAQAFSLRPEAGYLFGTSSLVFLATVIKSGYRPADVAGCYVLCLGACCFGFLAHPNGIACIVCWIALAILYWGRMGKYRIWVAGAFVVMLSLAVAYLLDGRSIPEFYHDLTMLEDTGHNFSVLQSIWQEAMYVKGALVAPHIAGLAILAALVVTIIRIFHWKTADRNPLEVLTALCFLFLTMESSKYPAYSLLFASPLLCVLIEQGYNLLAWAGTRQRLHPGAVRAMLCLAVLALTGAVGTMAWRDAQTNSLYQYAFGAGNFDYGKYASLKSELAGKELSKFTDLRIIPLFSFMDLSNYYRDEKGLGEDVNVPWDENGAFAICSKSLSSVSCDPMRQNRYYPSHSVTFVDSVGLFGDEFSIYHITSH